MPAKSGRGGADVPGVKTNEREGTRAVLRHSRMSASKVRQVLDLIRGQDVDRAAEILSLGDREAAVTVGKVLASAVANAVHNDGLDAEELFVSACYADEGSTLKRWRPRARGRASRIRKRTSHITIIVSRLPDDRIARRRAQQAANTSQRSRRVAGSRRRRQQAQATESTRRRPGRRQRVRSLARGRGERRRPGHRDRGRPAGGVGFRRRGRRGAARARWRPRPTRTPTAAGAADRTRSSRRRRKTTRADETKKKRTDGGSAEEKGK